MGAFKTEMKDFLEKHEKSVKEQSEKSEYSMKEQIKESERSMKWFVGAAAGILGLGLGFVGLLIKLFA